MGVSKQHIAFIFMIEEKTSIKQQAASRALLQAGFMLNLVSSAEARCMLGFASLSFLVSWGGVILSLLGTSATNWPIVPAPEDR
jgi:hypothetical protein